MSNVQPQQQPGIKLKPGRVIGAIIIVMLIGGVFGGHHDDNTAPAAQTASGTTPAKSDEKPEPTRPAVGQHVSEEYFDWISSKMHFECQQRIKKRVSNDMRTPGVFTGTNAMDLLFFLLRFSRWSKYVGEGNTVTIRGDEAEAQNGMGNWVRANYSCTVNIETKTVVDADLENGRLPLLH